MSSTFALFVCPCGEGADMRAARLKRAAWALSPGRLLYDDLPGLAIFHSDRTSQELLETFREVGWAEGDVILVINLTRPEYAQLGVVAQERLDHVMAQRGRIFSGLSGA